MSSEANGYRHFTESRVRFADLDAMGHLNNVALVQLIETSRVDYMVDLGLGTYNELTFVIVSLQCNFLAQAYYRDVLTCGTRAGRLGRTSLVLEHNVWNQHGTAVASAASTLVTLAEDATSSAPVPSDWITRLEDYEGQPMLTREPEVMTAHEQGQAPLQGSLQALFEAATGVSLTDGRTGDAVRLLAREIRLMAAFADRHGPLYPPPVPFDPSWD